MKHGAGESGVRMEGGGCFGKEIPLPGSPVEALEMEDNQQR